MIIVYSKLNIDRLLNRSRQISVGILIVLVLLVLLIVMRCPWQSGIQMGSCAPRSAFMQTKSSFAYESIGSGALALNPQQLAEWVQQIAQELIVVAHNSRPDVSQKEAEILIALKNAKEDQKSVVNGKMLFLEEGRLPKGLVFTEQPQPLWIKPILLDHGRVLVEVGRKIGSVDTSHNEEKGQFFVQPQPVAGGALSQGQNLFIQAFKTARCFGKDRLIECYGGREFQHLKDKCKIDFSFGGNGYACFVTQGDFLQWKEGLWKVVGEEGIVPYLPVAQVITMGAKGLEVTIWGESGFCPITLPIPTDAAIKTTVKMDQMLSSIHLRTSNQVSCVLGKKRMILKQGDWLLKTAVGWRTLRKKEDIEKCLSHQMRGELFIFDGMEKQAGRWILKGNMFDEMRTSMMPIILPIDVEKKKRSRRQGGSLVSKQLEKLA